jgi:hypothetical protein
MMGSQVNLNQVGKVKEPGRYMFKFGWVTMPETFRYRNDSRMQRSHSTSHLERKFVTLYDGSNL